MLFGVGSERRSAREVSEWLRTGRVNFRSLSTAGPQKRFLAKLRRQEELRQADEEPTRFEAGNLPLLDEWNSERRELTARFTVTIVQPGYSRAKARAEHMMLLSSVSSYLMQTYKIGFAFWSSP